MDPAVLARAWAESYAPLAPFVLQLTNRGQRTHAYFCAGDVHGWWEELFGYHTKPVRGVWYDISSGRLRGELTTVLFDAHGYAEARFEQSGIDPRQRPYVPEELPNVAELLARTGEKCEICFEPWSEQCVPEGPLRHEFETCCTHFACKECWLRLEKPRCPFCGWDLRSFLKGIDSDPVPRAARAPRVDKSAPLCGIEEPWHVGWLLASFQDLTAHFDHLPDPETVAFELNIDRRGVWLVNKTFRSDERTGIWAVVSSHASADAVLGGLAYLFGNVSKLRTFDLNWY